MSHLSLRSRPGRFAAFTSSTLGVMNLLGMVAFRYPTWFTTPDLRYRYDVDLLRVILQVCLAVSLGLGTWTFAVRHRRWLGGVGIATSLAAIAIGGFSPEPGQVLHETGPTIGFDWLVLDLLGSAIVFASIEKVWPKIRNQVMLRPFWRLDLAFFALNHLAIGALLFAGNHFAPSAFGWIRHARLEAAMHATPVWAQAIVLVLAADLVQYWVHRAFHEVPFLWRFHAVHHSTLFMDWLAGSRTHFVQVLADRTLVMVPLWFLGPDPVALNIYVAIAGFQAVFVHANFGMNFRFVKRWIVTPQFHHWHHSSEAPAIDTNYGVHVTLYDRLFGTYHLPEDKWPAHYGTVAAIPETLGGQLLYPFVPPAWFEKGREVVPGEDAVAKEPPA